MFCKICGVKFFYILCLNFDGIDINVNCLDIKVVLINVIEFDG